MSQKRTPRRRPQTRSIHGRNPLIKRLQVSKRSSAGLEHFFITTPRHVRFAKEMVALIRSVYRLRQPNSVHHDVTSYPWPIGASGCGKSHLIQRITGRAPLKKGDQS
jgi:hypothetical protein